MALENVTRRLGLVAQSDLSLLQFYALQLVSGTDYGCNLATASTQKPAGILQNKPKINQAADSAVAGISKYVAGGSIHVGDKLTATSTGALVATTSNKDCIWGVALNEASQYDIATMELADLSAVLSA